MQITRYINTISTHVHKYVFTLAQISHVFYVRMYVHTYLQCLNKNCDDCSQSSLLFIPWKFAPAMRVGQQLSQQVSKMIREQRGVRVAKPNISSSRRRKRSRRSWSLATWLNLFYSPHLQFISNKNKNPHSKQQRS